MIRIGGLALPVDGDLDQLRKRAARTLGVRPGALGELDIVRQSIDARRKDDVHYVYTVELSMANEVSVVRSAPGRNISLTERRPYAFPGVGRKAALPPVVVGMGPAGLFAALFLARNGIPSVILERGRDVDRRTLDVGAFWDTGILDEESNVQFGEGGAGTFSDGKLTTGTHDPRISAVLDVLVEAGAPADVKYSHKPHIGTDILRQVVKNIRRELISLGCDVRFGHRLAGLTVSGGVLAGIRVEGPTGPYRLPADALVLAPGHSARDTFPMLKEAGVPMEKKNFAIGVRVEHDQQAVSRQQYGPAFSQLPPSDYKLACHLPSGRSAFTFCVCPGGQVVAAASRQGGVVTNGMSLRARDGANINGGLLVGVGPEDFPEEDVLAGVWFQERWEKAAFRLGGGAFRAPAQRVEDFLQKRPSQGPGAILPTYQPGVAWTDLEGCLPGFVSDTLRGALPLMDRKLHGFAAPDGVLSRVRHAPPLPSAFCGMRTASPFSGACTPVARGLATPGASSARRWTASAWPSRWPGDKAPSPGPHLEDGAAGRP